MSPENFASTISLTNRPWSLNEIMDRLAVNSGDSFFQYAALQYAHRNGDAERALQQIEKMVGNSSLNGMPMPRQNVNRQPVNLLTLFSGATAVQECLQLEAMRDSFSQAARNFQPGAGTEFQERTSVESLKGPTVNSHPWNEMLAGSEKVPVVSVLSQFVPADFLMAESRSSDRLVDTIKMLCSWGDVVSQHVTKKAHAKNVVDVVCRQLRLDVSQIPDVQCAVVSSDLFLSEGSDVTVLLSAEELQYVELMSRRDGTEYRRDPMAREASHGLQAEPAPQSCSYLGRDYDEYMTPDRSVCAYVANFPGGVHVRSNSRRALHRIIEVHKEKTAAMGKTEEFRYIRTLMPEVKGADEVFVYLSDPFIRRLVGPELRITEQRRLTCFTRMKMLEHAVTLYRSEFGSNPGIDDLPRRMCSPSAFNEGGLICPDGGIYSLADEFEMPSAYCSHHGRCAFMTPCIDIPVSYANQEEVKTYNEFVENYSSYWQTFFDPIGIRITHDSEARTRSVETIILPLIENSVYSGLSAVLGGAEPDNLEAVSNPASNIMSAAFRFDKAKFLSMAANDPRSMYAGLLGAQLQGIDFESFIQNGLSNQISFNVCDSEPPFSLDISQMLSSLIGAMAVNSQARGGGAANIGSMHMWIAFLLGAINSPIYLALPVKEESTVDRFMDEVRHSLPVAFAQNRVGNVAELYSFTLPDGSEGFCISMSLMAAKFRIYCARIDNCFYIASKQSILLEISNSKMQPPKLDAIKYSDAAVIGHAMVRFRHENCRKIHDELLLAQAEHRRVACLGNLLPIEKLARAGLSREGASWQCPDGGEYSLENGICQCSVHGSAQRPAQLPQSEMPPLISNLRATTAQLCFLEDGLRAKVTLDIK